MGLVIFTDLDGTLIDGCYSFAPAKEALGATRAAGVPCVICSSKTRREIEHYRRMLGNADPFISENGGAVYVPEGYFGFPTGGGAERGSGYEVIRLGKPYGELRLALAALRNEGYPVKGFGDLPAGEIAERTGLPFEQAVMAKEREFDEPFYVEGDGAAIAEIAEAAQRKGLRVTVGRLCHLAGDNDKGRAVALLSALFRKARGNVVFAGLGDGPTDLPMLEAVDLPIVVARPDGTFDPVFSGRGFAQAGGRGPEGWNRAVLRLLGEHRQK